MEILKKIVIVIGILIVAIGLYFGAYLPFKKAKALISAIRSLQSVRSIKELEYRFDKVLGIGSPAARDETVGFMTEQLLNLLRSSPPKAIGEMVINYTEEITKPVLNNPASPELTKIILKLAILYQTGWSLYQDKIYALRAEELYLRGLEVSPNRPQFLYGLFDLYLATGNRVKAVAVGEEIIRFWPTDSLVKQNLERIQEAAL